MTMGHDPYQEMLDDPRLPFDLRWALVSEIDSTNRRFGIYRRFIQSWDALLGKPDVDKLSVFEVGSGSGGLSREIAAWGRERGLALDLHLYDAQEDVLKASLDKFDPKAQPELHLATPEHLAVYPDDSFDYVISLHVLHHIQPFEIAVSAMEQMLRIARRGVLVIDLENKPGSISFARVWNRLMGVSSALSADGIKSLRRAHDPRQLLNALRDAERREGMRLDLKRYPPLVPYWRLQATRAGRG
jgi:ubiquinone/menaquinone biosynthesis C-methylase UbiE